VQLATKGGEIIEIFKGDSDRGRFGHCFELWRLLTKERDSHHKRGNDRLFKIGRATGLRRLKKVKKSIASPFFNA
jgi:hypothetical protein